MDKRMGSGKKRIDIKKIEKESARMVTLSKRRKGIFKKAQQLQSLTGAKVSILVFSPAGRPFFHGDIATIDAALNAFSNNGSSTTSAGGCTTASNGSFDQH